jgi:tRNA (cytidine/uridine-2'-O-)-methyltransferase
MLHVILYQPEIPPNTGNIIRLCANTRTRLHLVGPLGFDLDEKKVRRAGLDYRELSDVRTYPDWSSYLERNDGLRLWAFSTRGSVIHSAARFERGDGLLFGPETRGLPKELLEKLGEQRVLRLPMGKNNRSLNLSNTVAVALYESLRQLDYPGLS